MSILGPGETDWLVVVVFFVFDRREAENWWFCTSELRVNDLATVEICRVGSIHSGNKTLVKKVSPPD